MEQGLERLQERLGYRFKTGALLVQALTHRSHGKSHNERLEFLGDSVLNCAVASMLYSRYARYDEGDLSRLRSNLVKQQALFEIGQALSLGEHLVLGEGERRSGGLRRPSILADTVEAIVGAIFLDSDFTQASAVIERLYEPVLKSVDPKTLGKDAKTLLQEYLQGRRIPLPVYEVVATHGAAHNQVFEVECSIPKLSVTVSGTGGSRRAAEQAAAKLALESAMKLQAATPRRAKASATGPAAPAAAASPSAGPAKGPATAANGPAPSNGPAPVAAPRSPAPGRPAAAPAPAKAPPEPDVDASASPGRSAAL
jgi:ribonuclease-3